MDAVIAKTLELTEIEMTDDVEYQSIYQWDSLKHVSLMLAIEAVFNIKIDDNLIVELNTIGALRKFASEIDKKNDDMNVSEQSKCENSKIQSEIHRGLNNVYVDRSSITNIDGQRGALEYRGYSIHDLAENSTFEETAYLLIYGELPSCKALKQFCNELYSMRQVPNQVMKLMESLADAHPMEALRTGISMLGAFEKNRVNSTRDQVIRKGIKLTSQIPILIAAHHAARMGKSLVPMKFDSSHAEFMLHLLLGEKPSDLAVKLIDRDLIIHADHSANASAFTARIATGCQSNMHAAITAAVAAFSGGLHGGAAECVMQLIDDVGAPENAVAYVQERWKRNEPVMGFGHRVYRTEDPRARHLRAAALNLSSVNNDMNDYEVVQAVVDAMTPYARHGIDANVDLYAGLVYRQLGLPDDLAVPVFVAGRTAGWVAQILEQYDNNILIRPLLKYVGPSKCEYKKENI